MLEPSAKLAVTLCPDCAKPLSRAADETLACASCSYQAPLEGGDAFGVIWGHRISSRQVVRYTRRHERA